MSRKIGLGKKKDLDAQLNLTPFIDLLSTCVCFLLITAVWIEIGTVEIKQSHGTEAAASKKVSYDLDVVFKSEKSLNLNLKRNGKRLKAINVKGNNFDEVISQLEDIIQNKIIKSGKKIIEIASATITPRSTVNYGQMVSAMDVLRKNQIVNIGVISVRGR